MRPLPRTPAPAADRRYTSPMRSLALLAGLLLVPATAGASPTFPPEIQTTLDLACKPDCTTCHTRPEGGYGTARKPFGLAMQSEGLMASSPNLIAGALQKLEASGSDVDKDGVPDVEELRNMEDPNTPDAALVCFNETPSDDGGCSVAHRGASGLAGWTALIVVGLVARVVGRKQSAG